MENYVVEQHYTEVQTTAEIQTKVLQFRELLTKEPHTREELQTGAD